MTSIAESYRYLLELPIEKEFVCNCAAFASFV